MATTTKNVLVTGTWKAIPFLLVSNVSQTTVEFWASGTAPTPSDIGHPLAPSTGLNKNVFEDAAVVVYFRSKQIEAMLTATESV